MKYFVDMRIFGLIYGISDRQMKYGILDICGIFDRYIEYQMNIWNITWNIGWIHAEGSR